MLDRMKEILKRLYVYPKKMKENIGKSYGLYTSQRVMLALIEKGLNRESAYDIVQKNAMKSWKSGIQFKKLLLKDKEVRKYLTMKEIESIFALKYYLKNVDYIFKRVFSRTNMRIK
jgi:adenylosuccinate lyase